MADGTNVGSIYYDLGLNTSKFDSVAAASSVKLKSLGGAFDGVANGMQSFATKMAIVVGASSLGLGHFADLAGQLQTTQQRMASLAGSTQAAQQVMGQLYNYVLGKPIAFPDASKAAATLLGYGVQANNVVDAMKTLSAFSIVNGADMQQLALAYGQVNAKGRLMGQEVIQLTNNFVPVSQVIAKYFNVSVQQAMELMDGGKVSAEDFNKAMANFIPQSAIEAQTNTFNNRMISLQGTIRSVGLALVGVRVDPKLGLVVEPGGVFDRLSNFLPKIAQSLKDMKPALVGVIDFMLSHSQDIIALIGGIATAFVAARVAAVGFAIASTIATGGVNLIVPIIVAVIGALAALQIKFNWIGKAIDFVKDVIGTLVDVFNNVTGAVGDFFGGIAKGVQAFVNFIADGVNAFGQALAAVGSAIVSIVTGIANFLAPILQFIQNLFVIVFGLIAIVILDRLIFMRDVFVTVWTAIFNFLAPIIQGIVSFFAGCMNALVGATTTTFNSIFDVIKTIFGAIVSFFSPAVNWLVDAGRAIIGGLVIGITSVAGSVWGVIKSVSAQIGNFFSGAGSWLYDVGKNIIGGLVNGIRDMIGAVTKAAGDVASAVTSRVKNLLGIHSPSKVFADIGKNVTAGFTKGIEDTAHLTRQTMQGFANTVIAPSVNMTPASGNSGSNVRYGDTHISIGTVEDRQDMDYLLRRIDINQRGLGRGVAPS